ncbi:MAG: glycyl-radical enzyme activating protein [Bacillota bacterium]
MRVRLFQRGFNYSQDGPGNRLVYHFQGCNMRCPWCANPEGLEKGGVLMVRKGRLLPEYCPFGAIHDNEIDRNICKTCKSRACIYEHPNRQITFSCKEYEVKELLDEASESRSLFIDGGGVTASGGEPTLQFDALEELLRGLKVLGINTAIESNATHPRLPSLFDIIDFLILDLKCVDGERHRTVTGVDNKTIKVNIRSALCCHPNVLIRVPLIGGFNTSKKDIEELISFFHCCGSTNVTVEFLGYHEYGKEKWAMCGYPYKPVNAFVPDETIKMFEDECKKAGLRVLHT